MFDPINQYPMMMPYVGKHYVAGGGTALILIGESHYLPSASTQHLTSESWYSGNYTTLSPKEKDWINTSQIIKDSRAEGFKNKAHSIYRNAFLEINEHGPRHEDYKAAADDVVYYNYFRRPALQGVSLVPDSTDVGIADRFFRDVYAQHCPAMVVFLSVHAFNYCASCRVIDVPLVVTPHPASAHWNRVSALRGNKRGRDLLGDAAATLWAKV